MKTWIWSADVGGTSIKMGVVEGGVLRARGEIVSEAERGLLPALERMCAEWERLMGEAGRSGERAEAVGIALPAIVDPSTERVWVAPAGKFSDAPGMDVRGWMKQRTGVATVLSNDAHAALAAEWQYGSAKGCESVCMMTLGTGVGTSVIVEGRPLRGAHGLAGNAGGHVTIQMDGEICGCGNVGCVETQGSSWALRRMVQKEAGYAASVLAGKERVDFEMVFAAADAGDEVARAVLERSLRAWGAAAVSLVNSFDPEKLVLGGGLMRRADVIVPALAAYVRAHAWARWEVPIVTASMGSDAGILGMAYLAGRGLA